MHIKNFNDLMMQITTRKDIAIMVLDQYETKNKRPGDYYNCPICNGKIGVFDSDGEWVINCFNGCIGGNVLDYLVDRENLGSRKEALLFINQKYNLNLDIDSDKAIDRLDKYISTWEPKKAGIKYLRHHYYKTIKNGKEIIDSVKVMYRNIETGKKVAKWFVISEKNGWYKAELSSSSARDKGQREKLKMLYNGHKIKDDTNVVCITEGEKDAESLCNMGFLGVSAQESGKWCSEYTEQIKNVSTIYIFTDNDNTGVKYANTIVEHFKDVWGEYSEEKILKIIDIPKLNLKSDITDYIEHLKGKGLTRGQIIQEIYNCIKESENLLSLHELHEDEHGIYKWMQDKKTETIKKNHIADFKIKVTQYVLCLDDDELSRYVVSITPQKGNSFNRPFLNSSMNDIRSFKLALDSPYCTFSGDMNDLNNLKRRMFNLKYDTKKVLTYGGMRELDGQWVYVENDKCLKGKDVTDEYTINDTTISIESDILSSNIITRAELNELGEHLFKFNNEPICYSVVGYAVATFLKARLRGLGIKFPHLFSTGEAGAGKSETLQNILLPFFGVNSMKSASNITKYSLDNYIASNNTIPCILDEYKPYMMAKWRVELISEVMRTSYDWLRSMRGTGKGTVKELEQRTNIVLNGEAGTDETAVIERSILLSFSKRDTLVKCQTEHFKWIKSHKELLTKLSATIIRKVVTLDDKTIQELYYAAEQMIPEEIATTRIRDALAINALGLMLLSTIFEGFDYERAIQVICKNSIEEVGTISKSIVDLTIEHMDRAIPIIIEKANDNYDLYRLVSKGEHLALRVNAIYPQFTKYIKEYNTGFIALPEAQFTKMLRKSQYYIDYKNTKFGRSKDADEIVPNNKGIRAFILDIEKLTKLDISNFIDEE